MGRVSEAVLIQPPFAQLNSPYPAPYYLKSFLEKRGLHVTVLDHSIGLFEKVFSRSGLERIFSDASRTSAAGFNKETVCIIERFLSEKELWLSSVERLIAFLRDKDHEWGHLLALANGRIPGGPRTDLFLLERERIVSVDEAKVFATLILADLADFITCTLDRGFSLIRYTPVMEGSLNTGFRDFAVVQRGLGGYIMENFYRPMLTEEWKKPMFNTDSPALLGLTIPFPGCLSGALVCAESAKKYFGSAVRTVAGGGYINTELRFLDTPEFFDYFDYVSFDRGYGSLVSVLHHIEAGNENEKSLYKTMFRRHGIVISPADAGGSRTMPDIEDEAVRTNFPDYTGVDFGRYLYPVDDTNPMHRLWSDGHWLKAYLAHGCYWHSCAFCDVSLDYIRNFMPVDTRALFAHLKSQAEKTGVRGVHFCDEAAPVSSLLEFAILNREAGLPLSFWGNIRFEKGFNSDTAAILAAGGLIGVSGGLEVVTERGLKAVGKGIDLESAVSAMASFREAGILTHAYLIYGYWDEDEQEIINSAEILRQLFEQGLLGSAFWHKFILTHHSRIYMEKQRGLHQDLKVKDNTVRAGSVFAFNDLSFEGEEKYEKYTEGLDRLLGAWMAGDTEVPVKKGFIFKVKPPSVSPGLVSDLLTDFAVNRNQAALFSAKEILLAGKMVLFLGSGPKIRIEGKSGRSKQAVALFWRWQSSDHNIGMKEKPEAEKLGCLLESASGGRGLDAADFFLLWRR